MKRACILALACLGTFGASALNVRDFGAVGDGVTDDTAAIQRAVDEASLTAVRLRIHIGGQVGDGPTAEVFFPKGTYLLDGTVAVTRDAVLRGEDGAIVRQTDPAADVFRFNSAFRCRVSSLAFEGGVRTLRFDTQNNDSANLTVRDCAFRASGGDAVECLGSPNSTLLTIEDCVFEGCHRAAHFACDGALVRRCRIVTDASATNSAFRVGGRVHFDGLDVTLGRTDCASRCAIEVMPGWVNFDLENSVFRTTDGTGACTVRSAAKPGYIASYIAFNGVTVESGADDEAAPLVLESGTVPNMISLSGLVETGVRHADSVHSVGGLTDEVLASARYFKGIPVERTYSRAECATARTRPVMPVAPERAQGPVLRATDYGVDENKDTDDTEALRRAFAAATGQEGATVLLPTTWVNVSETIEVPDGIAVVGIGTAGVRMTGGDSPIFSADGFSDLRFANLHFEAGSQALLVSARARTATDRKAYLELRDCFFSDASSYAIEATCGDGRANAADDLDVVVDGGVAFVRKLYRGNGNFWWDRAWLEMIPDPAAAGTRSSVACVNYGTMTVRDMLGVPMTLSDVQVSGDYRWIDNYGELDCLFTRFGGEWGGITPVYNHGLAQTRIEGGYSWFENDLAKRHPVVSDHRNGSASLYCVVMSANLDEYPVTLVWKDGSGVCQPTCRQKVVCCFPKADEPKTCVWTGAAGGTYIYANNPANWQDGQVPSDGDTVVLSTTSGGTIVYNLTATFENFYFTNTCGGTLSADRGTVRVSGTDSKVVCVQSGGIFFYCPFYVETGARLEFVEKEGHISFAGGKPFNGTGEFTLSGEKGDCGISVGSPDFHGTLHLRRSVTFTSSGLLTDPFGAADAVVNVYGTSTDPAFAGCSATLMSYRPVRFSNRFNFYHGTSMTMNPQQAGDVIATYDGDVTYTAGGGKTTFQMNIYGSAGTTVGHVFNGAFTVTKDCNGYLQTINYGSATHYIEFNGETYFGDNSSNFLDLGRSGKTCSKVYFGGPFSIKHSFLFNLRDNSEFYTTAPNVLPVKTLECRYYWDGKGDAKNTFLDLQGHDQKIGPIDYRDDQVIDNVTYVNESVLRSTGRPATLSTFNNNGNVTQIVPYLGGRISVFCYAAPNGNGSLQFPKGGDTTGWIGTEHKTVTFADTSFPDLGGIECTANGSVMIGQNVVLNPNMTLSTHDLTTGLGVRVRDGVNVDVRHVFADNVDVPAGVYCRTGGGVAGATEVPWLVRSQWDPDQSKGTVTVAEHDPVWIWTGRGSKTSFADAANWGVNAAPDLTNEKLTLNFGNAAGKANAVVPLDGTVSPAGAINMGDYSKGVVTFGGKGTLVLGGADADLKMSFIQSSSLTWNGPGKLVLTGRSTSRGTLTVVGGRVVMDFADWPGKVVVGEGAELVVNDSCASRHGVYTGPCVLGASNTPGFLMILR